MTTQYKVVICGNYASGKTSLLERFFYRRFSERSPTIGAAFSAWTYVDMNSPLSNRGYQKYSIGFFDTAGQERFNSMVSMYYRNADVILYCIASNSNIEEEIKRMKRFLTEIEQNENDSKLYLIITKQDLSSKSFDHLLNVKGDFAENSFVHLQNGSSNAGSPRNFERIFYTSAVTGYGVETFFNSLAKDLIKTKSKSQFDFEKEFPPQREGIRGKCCSL